MRDGWMLQNFSAIGYGNSDSADVYFYFSDENQQSWELVMELGDANVSYFSLIYNAEGYGITEIIMSYDCGMKFQVDAPGYLQLSYEVDPVEEYSCRVEDFDLATWSAVNGRNSLFQRSFPVVRQGRNCISHYSRTSSRFLCWLMVKRLKRFHRDGNGTG